MNASLSPPLARRKGPGLVGDEHAEVVADQMAQPAELVLRLLYREQVEASANTCEPLPGVRVARLTGPQLGDVERVHQRRSVSAHHGCSAAKARRTKHGCGPDPRPGALRLPSRGASRICQIRVLDL